MEWWQIAIAIIGGGIAGFINTLAGSGSAITLTILTEILGLPPNIANGSNRIGVFCQGIGSSYSFIKNKKLIWSKDRWIIMATFLGAMVGFWIATTISNASFKEVFKYLMVLMLFTVLIKPKRWINVSDANLENPAWWFYLLCFLIGIYGGFIQMGMGVFFLFLMVMGAKYNLIRSNAVKVFVTASYTIVGLTIFHYKGLVDWKAGGCIAIGQFIGGYITGKWISNHAKANEIAYYALLLALSIALFLLFF